MKKKMNGYLLAGIIITSVIILWIIAGRFYTPYNPTKMSSAKLQGPSPAHLFGTDKFGRDIFSRVMQGSGTTLVIAALTIVIGGGVAKMGEILFSRIRKFTEEYAFVANQGTYVIEPCRLMDDAVIAGALLAADGKWR